MTETHTVSVYPTGSPGCTYDIVAGCGDEGQNSFAAAHVGSYTMYLMAPCIVFQVIRASRRPSVFVDGVSVYVSPDTGASGSDCALATGLNPVWISVVPGLTSAAIL